MTLNDRLNNFRIALPGAKVTVPEVASNKSQKLRSPAIPRNLGSSM